MRNNRMASRFCCLASRYWRIAGVADVDIFCSLTDALTASGRPGRIRRGGRRTWYGPPTENLMHVLALDTTTRDGSVALVDDNGTLDERRGDAARTHGERLPGELLAVADAHGLSPHAIDLFAVASGPGSFT